MTLRCGLLVVPLALASCPSDPEDPATTQSSSADTTTSGPDSGSTTTPADTGSGSTSSPGTTTTVGSTTSSPPGSSDGEPPIDLPDLGPRDTVADIEVQLITPMTASAFPATFEMSIEVTNHGPDPASVLTALETLGPPGEEVRILSGCGISVPNSSCPFGELSPGQTETADFLLDATSGPVEFNLSFQTEADFDPDPSNNTDSATVLIR